MKKTFPLFVAILVLLASFSHIGSAKKPKAKVKPSGIYGKLVQIGFPPDHPSMGMEMPLSDMLVGIYSSDGENEIKRVTTNKYGLFNVSLPPGAYVVEPIPPDPDPLGFSGIGQSSKVVKVWRGFSTQTKVVYDAGW